MIRTNSNKLQSYSRAYAEYPFSFNEITYRSCLNQQNYELAQNGNNIDPNADQSENQKITSEQFDTDFSGKAIFLMFITWLTVIFTIILLVYYTFFELDILLSKINGRSIDFYLSISMTILTLLGAILFTDLSTGLRKSAKAFYLTSKIPECLNPSIDGFRTTCSHGRSIDLYKILSTVILSWVQFWIWLFTVWFAYKEKRVDGSEK